MSTIGAFGQSEAAIGVGAVGGTIIGAGGAVGYAGTTPVTRGEGLAYLSTSTWGLVAGHMLSDVLLPQQSESDDEFRLGMVVRTLGGLGGAYAGWKVMEHSPDLSDVLEMNLSTYLGVHSFIGLVDLLNQEPAKYRNFYDADDCEQASDDEGYDICGGVSERDMEEWYDRRYRIERAAGLAGGAIGAAIGYRLRDQWQPGQWDVAYAGIVGAEGAWLGATVPAAIGAGEPVGAVRLGFHLAAAAGLTYTHYRPATMDQVFMTGWGGIMGNVLGGGLGVAMNADYETANRVVSPLGLAGVVGGTWLGQDYELTVNDRTLMGVGTGLGTWNALMFSAWADDVGLGGPDWEGMGIVGLGLSGIASAAAAKWVELDSNYSAFVGTSAAWGAFYAITAMVASGADGEPSAAIATTLVASDLAAGLAAWAGSSQGIVDPSVAGVTTLTGLTGATLGTLAVLLGSDDGQAVSVGALIGATVGLGAGAAYVSRSPKAEESALGAIRLPDLPGEWSFNLAPTLMENGDVGAHVGVQGFGF